MGEPAHSRTVLVIMDDADLSEIVQDVLRSDGYGVLSTSRGDEALALMRQQGRPGLILLDTWKPGMPGRFLHQLRQDPVYRSIPVVLCTTYKRVTLPDVQGTLRMPFDLNELLLTVQEHYP